MSPSLASLALLLGCAISTANAFTAQLLPSIGLRISSATSTPVGLSRTVGARAIRFSLAPRMVFGLEGEVGQP